MQASMEMLPLIPSSQKIFFNKKPVKANQKKLTFHNMRTNEKYGEYVYWHEVSLPASCWNKVSPARDLRLKKLKSKPSKRNWHDCTKA